MPFERRELLRSSSGEFEIGPPFSFCFNSRLAFSNSKDAAKSRRTPKKRKKKLFNLVENETMSEIHPDKWFGF